MKNNQTNNRTIDQFWQFVRGDITSSEFEQWIYSDPTAENVLGKDLYLDVVSTNFLSKDSVFDIKKTLKRFLISVTNPSCMCSQLSNLAVVDMGDESEKVFFTFDKVKKRGNPYWWLSMYQCRECHQAWLVAQEERQNDVFCLYRLDTTMAENALNQDRWPNIFDHYENLLRVGVEAGKKVRFLDPLNSSLRWTISDLAKDRPNISISEIAELLNLDMDLAQEIARIVIKEDNVHISFDNV